MAYSYVNYTGDGTTANWTFKFPYLDPNNIFVTVNGERWFYNYVAPNTVQLIPTPAAGSAIQIFRDTVVAGMPHQWTDGSVLRDKDLNRLARFCLYCAEEQIDKGDINGGGGGLGNNLGLSIEEILRGIAGQITLDAFATDLVAEIGKISGSDAVIGSVAWNMLQESTARSTAIAAEAGARAAAILAEAAARDAAVTSVTSAYQAADSALASQITTLTAAVAGIGGAGVETETAARIAGDSALASQITTLAAQTTTAINAAVSTEASARASADTANANAITALTATVGTNTTAISTEASTRASADTALATRATNLEAASLATNNAATALTARVSTAETAITTETSARATAVSQVRADFAAADSTIAASVTSEANTRSSADSALATRATALEATTAGMGGRTVVALIADEASARTTADTANANATSTLQTSVNGLTTNLGTVQTQANASTTALGVVNANYTLKTQALSNGKLAVAGIGLNATATGTTAQSELVFAADKFQFISTIGGTSETPQNLLQLGTVGGVNTLILAPTRIGDKTVGSQMIVDGTITAAQIHTGTITTNEIAANTIKTTNINGGAVCQVYVTAYNGGGTNTVSWAKTDPDSVKYVPVCQTSSYTSYCYGFRQISLTGFTGPSFYQETPSYSGSSSSTYQVVVRRVVGGVPTVVWAGALSGSTGFSTTVGDSLPLTILDSTALGSPGTPVSLYYEVALAVTLQTSYLGAGHSVNIGATFPALTYPGQRFISMVEYQK